MELKLEHIQHYPEGLQLYQVCSKWANPKAGRIVEYKGFIVSRNGIFIHHRKDEYICGNAPIKDFKPILRPLSDLTKEIEVDGEKFVPLIDLVCIDGTLEDDKDRLYTKVYEGGEMKSYQLFYNTGGDEDDCILVIEDLFIDMVPYFNIRKLLEWHFDIFDLIEAGLAIDINTLNQI